MLIKINMPRSEHTVGDGIVAPISLEVGGVGDENASDRTRCKFVRSGVDNARIAKAPENTQSIIRRGRTEKKMVRCIVPPWAARAKVKENRSSGEGVRPETRRHISMKQERANAVVQSAKDTFGLTVLLGSIRACETKNCVVVRQKSAESKVVELFSIVSLKSKNATPKLRADIGVKRHQSGECIRLSSQRKSPHIVRIIIKDNQII